MELRFIGGPADGELIDVGNRYEWSVQKKTSKGEMFSERSLYLRQELACDVGSVFDSHRKTYYVMVLASIPNEKWIVMLLDNYRP